MRKCVLSKSRTRFYMKLMRKCALSKIDEKICVVQIAYCIENCESVMSKSRTGFSLRIDEKMCVVHIAYWILLVNCENLCFVKIAYSILLENCEKLCVVKSA